MKFIFRDKHKEQIKFYQDGSRMGLHSPNIWIRKSAAIEGWLFKGEPEYLWELAARSDQGDILEIGSWQGKSTCILAGACIEKAPHTKVICMDPFDMRGTPEQARYHKSITRNQSGTFYQFIRNANKFEFIEHVVPLASTAELSLSHLHPRLRMIFIDGEHSFQALEKDFMHSVCYLMSGGLLVFHDAVSGSWPEVRNFIRERVENNPQFQFLANENTIAAFIKV